MLLTISCSLRSIKIRSARRAVPTSCKPSNYGYNRHQVAYRTIDPIENLRNENFLSRGTLAERNLPTKKILPPWLTWFRQRCFGFLLFVWRAGAATPVLPSDSVPHFVWRKSDRCNESIRRCFKRTAHDWSRSRAESTSLVAEERRIQVRYERVFSGKIAA